MNQQLHADLTQIVSLYPVMIDNRPMTVRWDCAEHPARCTPAEYRLLRPSAFATAPVFAGTILALYELSSLPGEVPAGAKILRDTLMADLEEHPVLLNTCVGNEVIHNRYNGGRSIDVECEKFSAPLGSVAGHRKDIVQSVLGVTDLSRFDKAVEDLTGLKAYVDFGPTASEMPYVLCRIEKGNSFTRGKFIIGRQEEEGSKGIARYSEISPDARRRA